MSKCLNVIVFYDNYDEVMKYLENLFDNNSFETVDVSVVVNKDTLNCAHKLQKIYDNIHIYNYNVNIGYLNALLYVFNSIPNEKYEYYILCNTDIEYKTKNFFKCLLEKQYDKHIGCIAPSVYSCLNGNYSNPHYKSRISKGKMKRNILIFSNNFLSFIFYKLSHLKTILRKKEKQKSCYVYSPHGSYIILTTEFMNKIRHLDYEVILYSEESFLGELLIRNNYKCFYDEQLEIDHFESTVTSTLKKSKKNKYITKSLKYIYDKFYIDE